jgi:hypothetical protein
MLILLSQLRIDAQKSSHVSCRGLVRFQTGFSSLLLSNYTSFVRGLPLPSPPRACVMPPANPLKPSAIGAKKRKSSSTSSVKPGPSKVPRTTLDSFFPPRVSVSSGNKKETTIVTLNEEQRMVLRMVVEEGKSVFFTGSAGRLMIPVAF